jgi:hypothetical protein
MLPILMAPFSHVGFTRRGRADRSSPAALVHDHARRTLQCVHPSAEEAA